jgi:hypothetical protein
LDDAFASFIRTTIDLDPHLLRRLREEAHRQGIPFKQLLTAVLRRGLDAGAPRTRYRVPTFAMGSPGTLDLDKALVIAGALEDEETARKLRVRK